MANVDKIAIQTTRELKIGEGTRLSRCGLALEQQWRSGAIFQIEPPN